MNERGKSKEGMEKGGGVDRRWEMDFPIDRDNCTFLFSFGVSALITHPDVAYLSTQSLQSTSCRCCIATKVYPVRVRPLFGSLKQLVRVIVALLQPWMHLCHHEASALL